MRKGLRPLENGKWIQLKQIEYVDPKGKTRTWEMVERTTRYEKAGVDAVAIFPRVFRSSRPEEEDRTLLVKQYRPPLDAFTLEQCAGLVDHGETPEQAALRELKEETGYGGVVTRVTRGIYNDPGLSNANFSFVFVDIDLDKQTDVTPQPDEGESIEVLVVPMKGLLQYIEDACDQSKGKILVDAKCYSLALGLSLARL